MGPENGGVSITKPLQHLDLETLWGGAWGEPAAQVAAYHSSRATSPPLFGVPGRRGPTAHRAIAERSASSGMDSLTTAPIAALREEQDPRAVR